MTGYRVAEEPPPSPFEIDPERCRQQYFWQMVVLHGVFAVITLGLWLPGLVWAIAGPGARKHADGYFVRVRGGALTVGNPRKASSIPLDRIDRIAVDDGRVVIHQGRDKGSSQTTIYGLLDPHAAAEAILEAREDYLQGDPVEPAYEEEPRRRSRGKERSRGGSMG